MSAPGNIQSTFTSLQQIISASALAKSKVRNSSTCQVDIKSEERLKNLETTRASCPDFDLTNNKKNTLKFPDIVPLNYSP
jgi:hypothetical protein